MLVLSSVVVELGFNPLQGAGFAKICYRQSRGQLDCLFRSRLVKFCDSYSLALIRVFLGFVALSKSTLAYRSLFLARARV